jgi:predicted nucleic acid-binding protein
VRFVVDSGVVLHLAAREIEVSPRHELLAPTLIRSQALSAIHEAVHSGKLSRDAALERIARVNGIKIRLLGDAVLRRRAFEIADELGWAQTYEAEYLALTQLQADAFVTLDKQLARKAKGVVAVATVDALQA